MKQTKRYEAADTVVARDLGGEVVLMDLAGGDYFGLNEVGARIWWMIEADLAVEEICTTIADEFAVEHDVAERDANELLATLIEKNLIVSAEK